MSTRATSKASTKHADHLKQVHYLRPVTLPRWLFACLDVFSHLPSRVLGCKQAHHFATSSSPSMSLCLFSVLPCLCYQPTHQTSQATVSSRPNSARRSCPASSTRRLLFERLKLSNIGYFATAIGLFCLLDVMATTRLAGLLLASDSISTSVNLLRRKKKDKQQLTDSRVFSCKVEGERANDPSGIGIAGQLGWPNLASINIPKVHGKLPRSSLYTNLIDLYSIICTLNSFK